MYKLEMVSDYTTYPKKHLEYIRCRNGMTSAERMEK